MGARVVISVIREFADRLLGRGEGTIAVPPFDGALKPNQKLEEAETVFASPALEDLATDGARVFAADGAGLLALAPEGAKEIRRFERAISALACLPKGGFAVALAGQEVRIYRDLAASEPDVVFSNGLHAVNALAAFPDGTLIATDGSQSREVDAWAFDLMEHGRSGRTLALDPSNGSAKTLASGLCYAFGVCPTPDGVLVSESWRHRVILVGRDGATRVVLAHLPVYPSRLSPAAKGGYWLTAFVARSLLVEFVLREPAYRRRMMSEVPPEYWIAPRLRSGESFKEPLQGAHIKTMGVIKPWAPPRSYGLVIRLSAEGAPLYSLHSRVDGNNHGVAAAVEANGELLILAKGPGRILRLPVQPLDEEFAL